MVSTESGILGVVARLGSAFLDRLGGRCPVCAKGLDRQAREGFLCGPCSDRLSPMLGGYCPKCGQPYARSEVPDHLCLGCRENFRPWDNFAFHGPYEGQLRQLLLDFKFGQDHGLDALLQDLALKAFERHLPGEMPDGIVPVPLHRHRLRQRGFNQSQELARGMSRKMKVALLPQALVRIKATTPQSGLSRGQRLVNLEGCLRAVPALVEGRHLLLIDDIYTTGSTISVCARALRKAGAARIDVLVLARVR